MATVRRWRQVVLDSLEDQPNIVDRINATHLPYGMQILVLTHLEHGQGHLPLVSMEAGAPFPGSRN
jgi:hypothetical protein